MGAFDKPILGSLAFTLGDKCAILILYDKNKFNLPIRGKYGKVNFRSWEMYLDIKKSMSINIL